MTIRVSSSILSLPTFPAETEAQIMRKYNLQRLIRMAANENCYGASPIAAKAVRQAQANMNRYPESYSTELKNKISELCLVEASQIVIGNGSTELVQMIAKTFLQPGENCVTARQTFPIYQMAVRAINAACRLVDLKADCYDLQALLTAMDGDTRLMFIANPNNPTGTTVPEEELIEFLQRVPSDTIVVMDEAYGQYAFAPDRVAYISRYPNLILLRTFSKVYGLAALRIGYAICSQTVAEHLSRVAVPYSVNSIGQRAALAALEDSDHVAECVRKNAEQRDLVQREFAERKYRFVPSRANFVLLRVSDPAVVFEALLRNGILVSRVSHFNIADGIRITLGLPEENELFLQKLHPILATI